MTRNLCTGLVEHETRRQLAQTLLRTGPLTARGLAMETKRSKAYVSAHLKTLSRAQVVAATSEWSASEREVVYELKVRGLPAWAFESLFGEFALPTCFQIRGAIHKEGPLSLVGVVEKTGLSEYDALRYVMFMEASGYLRRAKGHWSVCLRLGKDDGVSWQDDES